MAQYIVTITPVLGSGGGDEDEASRTTMRVVAEDGQAYIKELTVRVAENAKLGPGEVMQVDLDILLQAFARRQPESVARSRVVAAPTRTFSSLAARGKPDRAYRRMPDPAEVKATYLASRTITGVAEHYGVPTHTAQGWVSRLRRKGVIPAGK
ncbi:MAG TPA: hypothetical protein DGT23_26455 [Micromonosporaceae bacterium]|nr:hypothetical protein [Micromonosporaceae bacterium]